MFEYPTVTILDTFGSLKKKVRAAEQQAKFFAERDIKYAKLFDSTFHTYLDNFDYDCLIDHITIARNFMGTKQ